MSAVRTAIADLVDLLKLAAAKKALIEDLTLLLDLCTKLNDTSLTAFESHVVSAFQIELGAANVDRLNVIDCYLARLEASLGDDAAFRAVYSELCADKRITQADVVSIASRFLSPIASSTSRPKALKHILKRHEKLLDHRNAASVIGSRAA